MQSTTILVVEDDAAIRDMLADYLRAEGFETHTVADGSAALSAARQLQPALVILDIGLPGIDGVELCRLLQHESDVYVLMLTARSDEVDKIVGLSVGADDYLTKPFSPRELLVRIKAILRRRRPTGEPGPSPRTSSRPALHFDNLRIDPSTRETWHAGAHIDLTPREFELLYTMAAAAGQVFSREQLLEQVWGHSFAGIDRVVDVHIGMLRRKLEADPANPTLIQTIRGVGYKFVGRRRRG